MRKYIYAITTLLLMAGSAAQASGFIVAGGKTNTAIVIYENKLDKISNQLILNEIGKQLAMGKISEYGIVTDQQGNSAKCAQFKLLQTYSESAELLLAIAAKAGVADAVQTVGGCRFDAVN